MNTKLKKPIVKKQAVNPQLLTLRLHPIRSNHKPLNVSLGIEKEIAGLKKEVIDLREQLNKTKIITLTIRPDAVYSHAKSLMKIKQNRTH